MESEFFYNWKEYKPSQQMGKLCYHLCSKQSVLPIRDLLNDHGKDFKSEPNYESATYNWCVKCNQPSVNAAVKDGLSHILFITRYNGLNKEYFGRCFIVGYYEIGWTAFLEERTAIRAKKMCFTPIEKAYEITDERWQRINLSGKTTSLQSLRHATQRISGSLLNEIVSTLDKSNITKRYLQETALLKSEYNPYKKVPMGRIFIINVGANTSSPLQSPLFENGRFEFVPIPESEAVSCENHINFGDLKQFYFPEKSLLSLFTESSISAIQPIHNDPEFLTFTYGDNVKTKSNLRKITKGDFLFFLARLVPYQNKRFHHDEAIFAFVGYLAVIEKLEKPDPILFNSPSYSENAHVRRWKTKPESFKHFTIFKGSTNSRRFKYAATFDRQLVETLPLLMADGGRWEWDRTTELGIIGANTRTPRIFIDPGNREARKQNERFWRYIFHTQKWDFGGIQDSCSCC